MDAQVGQRRGLATLGTPATGPLVGQQGDGAAPAKKAPAKKPAAKKPAAKKPAVKKAKAEA